MTDFVGRVAIITGGANGIGECTARTLARYGATVAILDKDRERGDLVRSEIVEAGGDAHFFELDLRDEQQVRGRVEEISGLLGRIDVLDNNAAALDLTTDDVDVVNLSSKTFVNTLQGDLLPAFLMTKYSLPIMIEQGRGSIVNIASVSGMAGERNLTAYGIAKAGIIQLTRATAVQYSKLGIRCNAISPAYVTTRNNEIYAPPELQSIYERNVLTPGVSSPQDIADIVVFLGSDEARMVTGHVLPADGGIMAGSPIVADYRDWQSQTSAVR